MPIRTNQEVILLTICASSLSHLVLFVLRCLTAFRSGLWSGPIPWNLPATGLTVSFTVKLLGQEGERDGRNSS